MLHCDLLEKVHVSKDVDWSRAKEHTIDCSMQNNCWINYTCGHALDRVHVYILTQLLFDSYRCAHIMLCSMIPLVCVHIIACIYNLSGRRCYYVPMPISNALQHSCDLPWQWTIDGDNVLVETTPITLHIRAITIQQSELLRVRDTVLILSFEHKRSTKQWSTCIAILITRLSI